MEVTRGDDQHVQGQAEEIQMSSGSLDSRNHIHQYHQQRGVTPTVPPAAVIPTLSREFVARRISEGETGRLKEELKCQACGKGYKHISSLAKHLWEHTPEWNMTSRLLISKHQQVQLLEAASILVSITEEEKAAIAAADTSTDTDPSTAISNVDNTTTPIKEETSGKTDDSHFTYSPLTTDSTASTGSGRIFTSGSASASDNSPSPPAFSNSNGVESSSSASPQPNSTNASGVALHHHHHHHHHYHHHHSHTPSALGAPGSATAGITKAPSSPYVRRSSLSHNPPSSANRRLSSSLVSRSAVTDFLLDAGPASSSLGATLGSPRSLGTVVASSLGNTAGDDYEALQSPYYRPRRMSNVRTAGPTRQHEDSGSSPQSMEDDNDADEEDNKQEFSVFGDMDD